MRTKDQRREKREPCYGKLIFLANQIPGYIRDISEQGMRIDIPLPYDPCVNPPCTSSVQVIPEGDAVFEPFSATLEIRWIRTDPPFTTIGAQLKDLESGKEKAYQTLLKLYRFHSSAEG
ncbi:MAG: PilZ domain-containing protein [Spirochaetales bacterium]